MLATLLMITQQQLPAAAQARLDEAKKGGWYSKAAALSPNFEATADGRSYLVSWRSVPNPTKWIVSLHGSNGYATDDLGLWSDALKDRSVGIVCLQWWLGGNVYLSPEEIYADVARFLLSIKVKPKSAMLHGFSRGSANSYAVMALDAGRGSHYFSLGVASSGGVGVDFPPNRALVRGGYGEQPLKGTRWITVAGARDGNPERDGIAGMRKAAAWLKEQGAVIVEAIEDPDEGHGALMRNPQNTKRVLDLFLGH